MNIALSMNMALYWKPFQWVLDKLWEYLFPKPKPAVERLAELQLKEREIEERLPRYVPQIRFAYKAAAREHPEANAMPSSALAKAIDVTPEDAVEVVRVLVKRGLLAPLPSPGATGETNYRLVS